MLVELYPKSCLDLFFCLSLPLQNHLNSIEDSPVCHEESFQLEEIHQSHIFMLHQIYCLKYLSPMYKQCQLCVPNVRKAKSDNGIPIFTQSRMFQHRVAASYIIVCSVAWRGAKLNSYPNSSLINIFENFVQVRKPCSYQALSNYIMSSFIKA